MNEKEKAGIKEDVEIIYDVGGSLPLAEASSVALRPAGSSAAPSAGLRPQRRWSILQQRCRHE